MKPAERTNQIVDQGRLEIAKKLWEEFKRDEAIKQKETDMTLRQQRCIQDREQKLQNLKRKNAMRHQRAIELSQSHRIELEQHAQQDHQNDEKRTREASERFLNMTVAKKKHRRDYKRHRDPSEERRKQIEAMANELAEREKRAIRCIERVNSQRKESRQARAMKHRLREDAVRENRTSAQRADEYRTEKTRSRLERAEALFQAKQKQLAAHRERTNALRLEEDAARSKMESIAEEFQTARSRTAFLKSLTKAMSNDKSALADSSVAISVANVSVSAEDVWHCIERLERSASPTKNLHRSVPASSGTGVSEHSQQPSLPGSIVSTNDNRYWPKSLWN
eukprot:TRINITY_DN93886_c0_g1_i1.p1 TRINITY_DN93886_c0_g1~~TRINITY_DN93886_c0_g1_i1.p1  ORF type:complete len:337 (-),score=60.17 TRINITY_DN93886_c0_g1_i1:40-1050(-)